MDILTLVLAKKMIEGLQFKTFNGESILGEGNIEIIEATEDDIIEFLDAHDVVKLLCDSTGYTYLDQDQKILVI